jgi:hypothetical protein
MEPRPGRIAGIVSIDLEHPRERAAAGFIASQERVQRLLNH